MPCHPRQGVSLILSRLIVAAMKIAFVGQPTVLANPAKSVMPVIALRASAPQSPATVAKDTS